MILTLATAPIGWAAIQKIHCRLDIASWVVLGILAGTSVILVEWTWLYLLGGSVHVVNAVVLLTWLSCCIFLIAKRSQITTLPSLRQWGTGLPVLILTLVVVLFFFVFPRVTEGRVGVVFRTGPDAIGQLNATDALLSDGSFGALQSKVLSSTEATSVDELFDQARPLVLQSLSKSLSIKGEFILGSLRIGYAGLTASLVRISDRLYMTSAMYSVSAFYLAMTCLLIIQVIRRHVGSWIIATAIALASIINVNILHTFHEGGVSQGFALVSLALLVYALLTPRLDQKQIFGIAAMSTIFSFTSYQDFFYLTAFCLLGLGTLSILTSNFELRRRLRTWWIATGTVLVVLMPLTLKSTGAFLRRLGDASQGGWSVMRWPDMLSIFGVINVYKDAGSSSEEVRPIVQNLLSSLFPSLEIELLVLVPIIAGVLVMRVRRNAFPHHTTEGSLALTFGSLLVISYFLTRYSGEGSNYVFIKLVASLAPFLPLIVSSFGKSRLAEMKHSAPYIVVVYLFVTLVGFSSLNYVNEFRRQSLKIQQIDIQQISSPTSSESLQKYALLGPYRWDSVALTPYWPATIVRGSERGVSPIIPNDVEFALLVRKDQCDGWRCLSRMDQSLVIRISPSFRLIPLGIAGSTFNNLTYEGRLVLVNNRVRELGGPFVESDFSIVPT